MPLTVVLPQVGVQLDPAMLVLVMLVVLLVAELSQETRIWPEDLEDEPLGC